MSGTINIHPIGGKSVAEHMYNLVCERGHRWATREPFSCVGQECRMHNPKGRGYCKKPLMLIEGVRPKRTRKVVKKKRHNKVLKVKRY